MARYLSRLFLSKHKYFHNFALGLTVKCYPHRNFSLPFHVETCELLRKGHRNFSSALHCWKCAAMRSGTEIFCSRCNVLQKPDINSNYFDIFNLKPSFELEQRDLTTHYHKLQNILHPDRFANSMEEERQYSADYSALVNKAYTTLLHPLSRGLYMLKLEGIHLDEGNVQSDPKFLMEIMEKNEEVDQAKTYSEIASLDAENKAVLEELTRTVADAFRAGDLKAVTEALIKMKYYVRIDSKIKDLKLKIGFVD
ncbi:iron-sulfur cluster co-chaperone protein HscB [Anabrus simplex]|uniref:iron-sulfur cluster co-chaperone protein HscB n=1 Tax=Anabrus simplex TaxID=316456 RepID=UPI0035A2A303